MSFKQAQWDEPLLKDLIKEESEGQAIEIPEPIADEEIDLPEEMRREEDPEIPGLSQIEIMRHYTRLSEMNFGIETGIYPLGSCTMKYNPKINEEIASWEEVTNTHPYQDPSTVQGSLEIMYELEEWLKEITGMDRFTLQPAAGAHGEFTGALIIREYLDNERNEIIVPDSAHGTNPASASMAGFKVVEIPSNDEGTVNIEALKEAVDENTAGLMLTNPNTLGIFEKDITKIEEILHDAGGLLYYDGANLNGTMGKARPGDMGFDIVHLNLHKTFSTPHGGGGPGSGPVGVKNHLKDYLPVPLVEKNDEEYRLNYNLPNSIGRVRSYYGNFGVMVKALAYMKRMGKDLERVTEDAVLNSNYITQKIKNTKGLELPFKELRKHETVFSAEPMKEDIEVDANDIAKNLLDKGIHAPTMYFPLIFHEALMIEPTETESKEYLDKFVEGIKTITENAYKKTEKAKDTPKNTYRTRLDQTKAARNPVFSWRME